MTSRKSTKKTQTDAAPTPREIVTDVIKGLLQQYGLLSVEALSRMCECRTDLIKEVIQTGLDDCTIKPEIRKGNKYYALEEQTSPDVEVPSEERVEILVAPPEKTIKRTPHPSANEKGQHALLNTLLRQFNTHQITPTQYIDLLEELLQRSK